MVLDYRARGSNRTGRPHPEPIALMGVPREAMVLAAVIFRLTADL